MVRSVNNAFKHKKYDDFVVEDVIDDIDVIVVEDVIDDIESSYCGLNCKACQKYISNECLNCTYHSKKIECPVYLCAIGKDFTSCKQCPEKDVCVIRTSEIQKCEQNILKEPIFEDGACYLVNDVSMSAACKIFELQVSKRKPCFFITKYQSGKTSFTHGGSKPPIAYLTQDVLKDKVCIKPNDYEKLFDVMNGYLKKAQGESIILNDFDILLENARTSDDKNRLLMYIQKIFDIVGSNNATLFIVSGKYASSSSSSIKKGEWYKLPNPSYIEWLRPLHMQHICNDVISYLSIGENDKLKIVSQLNDNSNDFECSFENKMFKYTPKIMPSRSETIRDIRKCYERLGIHDSNDNVKSIIYDNLSAFGYSPFEYILDAKNSYMILDIDISDALTVIKETVEYGKYGLCITRMSPDDFILQFPHHSVTILQLTQISGKNHFPPTSLGQIQNAILSYIQKHDECIIFFDGVEYLVAHNGFTKTLQFIQYIKDYAQAEKSLLIVPLSRQAFTKQEFAFLEKEFKRFELKEDKSMSDVISSFMG